LSHQRNARDTPGRQLRSAIQSPLTEERPKRHPGEERKEGRKDRGTHLLRMGTARG